MRLCNQPSINVTVPRVAPWVAAAFSAAVSGEREVGVSGARVGVAGKSLGKEGLIPTASKLGL